MISISLIFFSYKDLFSILLHKMQYAIHNVLDLEKLLSICGYINLHYTSNV